MSSVSMTDRWEQLILVGFGLFVVASTFSIAMAQVTFGLALVLFLIHIFRIKHNPFSDSLRDIYLMIGLYILWMILSAVVGSGWIEGIRQIKGLWLFTIIPVGIFVCRRERVPGLILIALAFVTLSGSLAGIFQFFTGISWPGVDAPLEDSLFGHRAQGFFSSRSTFAHCFAMLALLFLSLGLTPLRGKRAQAIKLLFGLTGVMAMLAVVLSFNRAAIGGLIIGLLLLLIWLGRRSWISIMTLLATVVILVFAIPGLQERIAKTVTIDMSENMYTGRLYIWQQSVEIVKQNPILGVGQGNYHAQYLKITGRSNKDSRLPHEAHNDYLTIAANGGLPAIAIFLSLWFFVIRSLWQRRSKEGAGLVCLSPGLVAISGALVMSLFTSLFEDEEALQMVLLIWTLGLARTESALLAPMSATPSEIEQE